MAALTAARLILISLVLIGKDAVRRVTDAGSTIETIGIDHKSHIRAPVAKLTPLSFSLEVESAAKSAYTLVST